MRVPADPSTDLQLSLLTGHKTQALLLRSVRPLIVTPFQPQRGIRCACQLSRCGGLASFFF